jgi:hypothetical protein
MMDNIVLVLLGMILMGVAGWFASRKTGFLSQRPADYADKSPLFDMREYLNGPIQCEGMIYGPMGRVSSRFVADMDVTWTGNVGMMTERFFYDSGTVQDRKWTLTLGNDGSVKAEADDVIGAGRGMQKGSALELKYRIRLPDSAGGHVLDAVDWMYLVENGTIMNRSQFRKYGIKVAELVATMRRKEMA